MKILILIYSLLFHSVFTFCQDKYRVNLCKKIINKNRINKIEHFKSQEKGYGMISYELKYLGEAHKKYKIVTISVFSGIGKHAVNEVYVFTKAKEYIGRFRGFIYPNLPNLLKKNKLIFLKYKTNQCSALIEVDFPLIIPSQLEISCNDLNKVIYLFSKKGE